MCASYICEGGVTEFVPGDVEPAQQPPLPPPSGPRPAPALSLLHYLPHPVPRLSQWAERGRDSGRG